MNSFVYPSKVSTRTFWGSKAPLKGDVSHDLQEGERLPSKKKMLSYLYIFKNNFIYVCISCCVVRAHCCMGISLIRAIWATLHCGVWASHCRGFPREAELELEQVLLVHPESPHIPYSLAHLHTQGV